MKENAFTHYVRDEELYGRFKDAAREDKLPILDKSLRNFNSSSVNNSSVLIFKIGRPR